VVLLLREGKAAEGEKGRGRGGVGEQEGKGRRKGRSFPHGFGGVDALKSCPHGHF